MRKFSFLIILLLLFSTPAFCADKSTHIHAELKKIKGKIKKKTEKLNTIRNRYFKIKSKITIIDKRTRKLHENIRQGKKAVRKMEKRIVLLESSIGYLKGEIGNKKEILDTHFKTFLVTTFRKEQYIPRGDISPLWMMCMLGKTSAAFKESIVKYKIKLERLEKDKNWLEILVSKKKKAVSWIDEQKKMLVQEKKKKEHLLASLEHSKKMYISEIRRLEKRKESLETVLVEIVKEELKKRHAYKKVEKPFYLLKRKLIFPVKEGTIASRFGKKYDKVIGIYTRNNGIDIKVKREQGVYAIYSGRVDYVGQVPGYGETIILNHLNNYYTVYAGMDTVYVRENDKVVEGRRLGKVMECLHFELRKQTLALNPLNWLSYKNIGRKR